MKVKFSRMVSNTALIVVAFVGLIVGILVVMGCFIGYTNWKKKREDPPARYCPITQTKVIPKVDSTKNIVKGVSHIYVPFLMIILRQIAEN